MFSVHFSAFNFWYSCFVMGVFGAAMGSFLNCAAYRIAHGESFMTGRSRCPNCGHVLGPPDLVPILSWLFLRGKCRHCGAPVAARYFLTECAFCALSILYLLRFDWSVALARNYVFLSCLFCLSLVDLDSFIIPDGCLILSALAWVLALPWMGYALRDIGIFLLSAALYGGGTLALSLVMDRVLRKDSLGGGDIKLFAVMGLYLGPIASLFALILACVLGLLFAWATRRGAGTPFPFGPAIAAAIAFTLVFGDNLTAWYAGLIGL